MKRTPSPWIDISLPLHTDMLVWPSDPPTIVSLVSDMAKGAACNVSTLSMSAHAGTHMDAPRHFLARGAGIDRTPAEAGIGAARVIEIRGRKIIGASDLRGLRIRRGERLLFKTDNSRRIRRTSAFFEDYAHLSADAARFLAAKGVRLLGIDYLSVGGYETDSEETHRALLSAGICVLEGLDLSRVSPGSGFLVAVPLRIENGDGAPCRAFFRPRRRD